VTLHRSALALLLATSVSACSFAVMRRPGPGATDRDLPPSCSGEAGLIVFDAIGSVGSLASGVVLAALSSLAGTSWTDERDDDDDDEARWLAIGAGAAFLSTFAFAASATHGGIARSQCRTAVASWRSKHPQPTPIALDAALARSALVAIQADLAACSDGEDIASAIRATVTVAASGLVSTVDIASAVADGRAPCIEAVLRAVRFPPTQLGGSFVYQARGPRR
jgi:hypothetical protein